jgi:hypothetical protein
LALKDKTIFRGKYLAKKRPNNLQRKIFRTIFRGKYLVLKDKTKHFPDYPDTETKILKQIQRQISKLRYSNPTLKVETFSHLREGAKKR